MRANKLILLCIGITLLFFCMIDLNPLNNTLAATLSDLKRRISSLENVRQPYISAWTEITTTATGDSSGVITTNDDIVNRLSVGDKIRLKQGGNYKYFYVIGLAGSSSIGPTGDESWQSFITLDAGSDYALTTAAVTDLASSKAANPLGHPVLFNYTISSSTVSALVMSIGSISGNAKYWMQGNIVYYTGYMNGTTAGSNGPYIFINLPINQLDSSFPNVATDEPCIIVNELSTYKVLKAELNLASYTDKLAFSKLDGTNMVVGGVFLQWSTFYIIN